MSPSLQKPQRVRGVQSKNPLADCSDSLDEVYSGYHGQGRILVDRSISHRINLAVPGPFHPSFSATLFIQANIHRTAPFESLVSIIPHPPLHGGNPHIPRNESFCKKLDPVRGFDMGRNKSERQCRRNQEMGSCKI